MRGIPDLLASVGLRVIRTDTKATLPAAASAEGWSTGASIAEPTMIPTTRARWPPRNLLLVFPYNRGVEELHASGVCSSPAPDYPGGPTTNQDRHRQPRENPLQPGDAAVVRRGFRAAFIHCPASHIGPTPGRVWTLAICTAPPSRPSCTCPHAKVESFNMRVPLARRPLSSWPTTVTVFTCTDVPALTAQMVTPCHTCGGAAAPTSRAADRPSPRAVSTRHRGSYRP